MPASRRTWRRAGDPVVTGPAPTALRGVARSAAGHRLRLRRNDTAASAQSATAESPAAPAPVLGRPDGCVELRLGDSLGEGPGAGAEDSGVRSGVDGVGVGTGA